MTSAMLEESQPIPLVQSSSFCQLNDSDRDLISPESGKVDTHVTYAVEQRNLEYSRILQNTFFRTSTPILGAEYRRNCFSSANVFPASSFPKCKSLKDHETESFINIYDSRSLDLRERSSGNLGHRDKRVFMSLYNLTCPNTSSIVELKSLSVNPTNIFFSHSRSYGSLQETDIDSGREVSKPMYKETNLNSTPIMKLATTKARSDGNRLAICADIDENVLNKCALSLSTNLLYVRLRENATTPAQIRVAKSITKLNVPGWMSPIKVCEGSATWRQSAVPQTQTVHRNPKPRETISRLKSVTPPLRSPVPHSSPHFSLPSTKYHKTGGRLERIVVSRARQALQTSTFPTPTAITADEANRAITALSKEFLSNLNAVVKDTPTFTTKDERLCSRSKCSKDVTTFRSASTVCGMCSDVYCSLRCMKGDRKVHLRGCITGVMKQGLTTLLDSLRGVQLLMLQKMFELGRGNLGQGLIVWDVDYDVADRTMKYRLPVYEVATESSRVNVTAKLKDVLESDFLLVVTSREKSSNSFVDLAKCYRRLLESDGGRGDDPIRTRSCRYSSLSLEERERLFCGIVSLLHSFDVDIQEKSPAVYFRLVEYVTNGCCFLRQVISVCDPRSGTPLQIIIEPDQLPLQVKM